MTILPLNPAENASPDALRDFLEQCRAAAERDGRPKLVSISITVDALDPLAVLESIFEPHEPHFYAERPSLTTAIAGAEAAVVLTTSGPDRFAAVQRFIDETLAHTIAVGDVDAPFGGPHFFTAFTFFDDVGEQEPFAAAQVFVPRWQVARAGTTTTAVANLRVDPGADLTPLTERVWRAHAKFRRFDFAESDASRLGSSSTGISPVGSRSMGVPPMGSTTKLHGRDAHATRSHGQDAHATSDAAATIRETGDYRSAVAAALGRIEAGEFEKIVLARALEVTAGAHLHPLRMLNGLRQRFPDCFAFSVANGRGESFIGASPERIVRVSQGWLETDALAGTARRGLGAAEDAALGAALLRSEKDRREQRLVLDSIRRRLAPLGVALEYPEQPTLLRLANVQHLHTPIRAHLPEGIRLLDALGQLHPTPAVGGSPREAALAAIPALEGFPRGLYAGALGWINARGGGEFFVGIRSALVQDHTARVYAGAGIVAGSDPEREYAETELKFRALLDAFLS
jgi:menaquinone-specific isochorismate synthase